MNNQPVIILFTVDPGGSNAIGVIENSLSRQFQVFCFAREAAYSHLKKNNLTNNAILIADSHSQYSQTFFHKLLDELKPIVVITDTTARDYSNRSLWQACKTLQIPTIAILDQWVNYSLRFLRKHQTYQEKHSYRLEEYIFPNAIVTMDNSAKSQMIDEGIPGDIIHVLGSPYYAKLQTQSNSKHTLHTKTLNILFASEPITKTYGVLLGKKIYGYTERSILNALCAQLASEENIKLTIRAHPRESKLRYNYLIKQFSNVALCTKKNVTEAICTYDAIIGMSSTMLVEGALLQKPVVSIQIGNHGNSTYYLEKIGLAKSIRYQYQLRSVFKQLILSSRNPYTTKLPVQEGAMQKLLELINQMISRK